MINLKLNFARSSNIKLDFQNKDNIKNILLSDKLQRSYCDLVDPMLNDSSNQRVHVIAGTPGTGKSTFALYVAHSLNQESQEQVAASFIKQKEHVTPAFDKYFTACQDKRYLPVFLNGDEGDIEDAFYTALNNSFNEKGWEQEFEGLVEHCSTRAVNIVNVWRLNYPEKYQELQEFVKTQPVTNFDNFMRNLRRHRRGAQKQFKEAYRTITGGGTVDAHRHGQVIGLYEDATQFLKKEKNMHGILIIYDEFGKHLERGVRQPHGFDLHFLQNIAELCNKGEDKHIHMLLITHLPVSQYTSKLSNTVQQEWKKIEGRFQQSSFNSNNVSSYTLAAAVFDSKIKKVANNMYHFLHDASAKWKAANKKVSNFAAMRDISIDMLVQSYPLDPSVFSLLPLLSEKVAQNERTMFSFLTRNEEHALPHYLEKNPVSIRSLKYLTPLDLYYYFQPLIASDVGVDGTCKIGLVVDSALNNLGESDQCAKDIIVILGIADIINNRSLVQTTQNSIIALLSNLHTTDTVDGCLSKLLETKAIIFNRVKGEYSLFEGSPVNLQEEIAKHRKKRSSSSSLVKILKEIFSLGYIQPKKYNFQCGITRFFKEHVLSVEDLKNNKNKVDYSKEDGGVFYIVPFTSEEVKEIQSHCKQIDKASSLFITTDEPLEIADELLDLQAVHYLYTQKDLLATGETVQKELEHYKTTSYKLLRKAMRIFKSYEHMNVTCFYKGKEIAKGVSHLPQIEHILSDICVKEYSKYPHLSNEMLNRHKPAKLATQGRTKVIEAIQKRTKEKDFGIRDQDIEYGIYSSLTMGNSFSSEEDGRLTLTHGSYLMWLFADFKKVLSESEQNAVTFATLIKRWQQPPFGIRTSTLPLYINIFIRMLPSPISFFHEGLYINDVDTVTFDGIIKFPQKYSMKWVEIDQKKQDYLKELVDCFTTGLMTAEDLPKRLNFVTVARVISMYYSSIPKYTREHPDLADKEKKLVIALNSFFQPESFILKDLPFIYTGKQFEELEASEIKLFINKLNKDAGSLFYCYVKLIKQVAKKLNEALERIITAIGSNTYGLSEIPLSERWPTVMNRLPADVLSFPFSEVTSRFVKRALTVNKECNNQQTVENIADSLTDTNPKSWNEKSESLFNFNLNRTLSEIEEVYCFSSNSGNNSLVRVSRIQGKTNSVMELTCSEIVNEEALEHIKKIINNLSVNGKNTVLVKALEYYNLKDKE